MNEIIFRGAKAIAEAKKRKLPLWLQPRTWGMDYEVTIEDAEALVKRQPDQATYIYCPVKISKKSDMPPFHRA